MVDGIIEAFIFLAICFYALISFLVFKLHDFIYGEKNIMSFIPIVNMYFWGKVIINNYFGYILLGLFFVSVMLILFVNASMFISIFAIFLIILFIITLIKYFRLKKISDIATHNF